ncbi:MAG: ROK family protein [Rubripirellula sp.]|nr:ROK family protein [Rubripirellula sp.]
MTRQLSSTDVEFVEKLFLGIDVGGTNVKLGLVDAGGTVHRRGTTPTPALGTPQRIFDFAMQFAMQQLEDLARSQSDLAGVGLAVPGVLDTRAFELREVVNLPGWHGQPLLKLLCSASSLPSAVVNDANSAAYAEHTSRALGNRSLALITLGTGIGCGLVVNGSPYGGDHGCAGELGHIAIRFDDDALPCTCGSRGHLESYAGAGGLIKRLRSAIATEGPSHFTAELLSDHVTPLDIAAEAENGSQICQQLIDESAQYVGQAIGMIGQVIDPEVVLLGGAMTFGGNATNTGRRFLERVRDTVKATTLVQVGTNMQVDFATLGNDAGVLGAAMIAKQVSQP